MKCRYTAYIVVEEYNGGTSSIEQAPQTDKVDAMRILGNPFTELLHLSIKVAEGLSATTKLLKIYNSTGELIRVVDLSELGAGEHDIMVSFSDLPRGLYFIMYQENNSCRQVVKGVKI
jgi:hypothetical protein